MARPRTDARRHGVLTLAVFNLLYWPYLLTSCAVLFFPALLLWLAGLGDPKKRMLAWFTTRWGAHYLAQAPLAGVTVEGAENAPLDRACVYVANHQSMVDILALFATHVPYKWVSKVENFWVPFLGWNMWLNQYVALKRGNLPSVMRMVRTCHARLRAGHSLFVFPEGTRSTTGQIGSFFRGAFVIAAKNKVPLVPMVVEGTGDILPKGTFCIRPRQTWVRILPPIDPAEVGYDARRLSALARERMATELADLRRRDAAASR
ncbi:MAG: lysophospholipid acyltransferase family protein [Polyangiaceae bacterium]